MNPTPDHMTLSEAAKHIGVTYSALSRQWRHLGLLPFGKRGSSYLFPAHLVDEFYISLQGHGQGRPTIRWLPWDTTALLQVLHARTFTQTHRFIPFFSTKNRQSHNWQRRYHPSLIYQWTKDNEHTFDFLAGFTEPSKAYWALKLRSLAALEKVRPHHDLRGLEYLLRWDLPAPTEVGQLHSLPHRDPIH